MRKIRLLLLCGIVGMTLCRAGEAPGGSWRARFWGNTVFSGWSGTKEISLERVWDCNYWYIDLNKTLSDAERKQRLHRAGTTIMLSGRFTAPGGIYHFRTVETHPKNGFALRMEIDGVDPAEFPEGVTLTEGEHTARIFARLKTRRSHPTLAIRPEWRPADAAEFQPLAVVAAPADDAYEPVRFDREFSAAEGEHRYYSFRTFTFDIPEDGLYDLVIRTDGNIGYAQRLWLDGMQALFASGEHSGVRESFYGAGGGYGDRHRLKVDFFGCLRCRRFLKRGSHSLDYYAHYGAFLDSDEMDEVLRRTRLGYIRLTGKNRRSETAFYPAGRDSMVFARCEPLEIRAQTAWNGRQKAYTMRVFPERGTRPVWEKTLQVTTVPEKFSYPCDREGAWEYVITDEDGVAVDGPWGFAVVDPRPETAPGGKAVVVDTVDCARTDHRFRDSGNSAVVSDHGITYRKTGDRGFTDVKNYYITEKNGKIRFAEPKEKNRAKMFNGCDWFAYTLNVKNPGRAHIVRCTIPNDEKRLITVYATDWVTGNYNGWSVSAGDASHAGATGELAFYAWPNTTALDVLVINSGGNHGFRNNRQGAVCKIVLEEYPDGLPALTPASGVFDTDKECCSSGEQVNLGINERTMPPLWNDGTMVRTDVGGRPSVRHGWNAFFTAWRRFGEVARHLGHNFRSEPIYSYGMALFQGPARRLLPQGSDHYAKGGPTDEMTDLFDRDIFALMVMMGSKYGVRIAADLMIQKMYVHYAECWARADKISPQGLMLSKTPDGKVYKTYSAASFPNPAHPVARRRMVELVTEIARRYGRYPGFAGIHQRFWTSWPSGMEGWFYNDELGYDDYTVGVFARENQLNIPPVGNDETAFAARANRLRKEYGGKWYRWREEKVLSLRREMLTAIRRHAPRARLYAEMADPEDKNTRWRKGSGLENMMRGGEREIGFSVATARTQDKYGVEWNCPDPYCFRDFDIRPAPYGSKPWTERDTERMNVYPQGYCEVGTTRIGNYALEKAAKKLALNQLESLEVGGQWTLPPALESVRDFVREWRAIPARRDWAQFPCGGGTSAPFAVWSATDNDSLLYWAVNRTDRPRTLQLRFADGTAAEHLIAPFMVRNFRRAGNSSITSAETPVETDEANALTAAANFIFAWEPQACGEKFTAMTAPLREALAAGRFHELRRLLDDLRADGRWWFEAYGWPLDFCVLRENLGGYNPLANEYDSMLKKKKFDHVVSAVPGADTVKRAEFRERMLTVPAGTAFPIHEHNGITGSVEVQVTALFGDGYGDIVIIQNDREIGRITADPRQSPRMETRRCAVPLIKKHPGIDYVLRGDGPRGMCLYKVIARPAEK